MSHVDYDLIAEVIEDTGVEVNAVAVLRRVFGDIPLVQQMSMKDDRDYFYVETINFKVENTHFRLPKSGFELPGTFFADMFTIPGPGKNSTQDEGIDEDHPIVVQGISKVHFKAFIRVLYPELYRILPNSNLAPTGPPATYDEWVGVLRLATMWNFFEIRKLAIGAISTLMDNHTMSEKIALAKTYNVKEWLSNVYRFILDIKNPLDVDDLMILGGFSESQTIKIYRLREGYYRQIRCQYCRRGVQMHSSNISDEVIMKEFAPDFSGMQDE